MCYSFKETNGFMLKHCLPHPPPPPPTPYAHVEETGMSVPLENWPDFSSGLCELQTHIWGSPFAPEGDA